MSEHDEFKKHLLNTSWRIYKTVEVMGTQGPVKLDIRMPPYDVLKGLLSKAKDLKERKDAGDADAMSFIEDVIATTVWRPGAVRPLFVAEEVRTWPYASAVQADCLAAINVAQGLESAKGNSAATPASP
ncbi:hypothetical protein ACN28E_24940 [Archangium lansingense]|uniref:hypothetical protein n=1 Tax=Archangium lansingense TaxID=2995310 RepID=UPI003B8095D8